jgi:integrase
LLKVFLVVGGLNCPSCSSDRIYKDGTRTNGNGESVQRFLCRDCAYRFSEPGKSYKVCKTMDNRQLCVFEKAKKLDSTTEIKTVVGESPAIDSDTRGKLIEFLWWMKKQGYKESTITSRAARLKRLVNLNANLFDPEDVKEVIAKQTKWKESRKEGVAYAYDLFAKYFGIKWQRPIYKAVRTIPFIPTEREIDDIVASCNRHIALFLQFAKETGARAGEIYSLEWEDINQESATIKITPEKGSNPRILHYSRKLADMLSKTQKTESRIFTHYKNLENLRRTFDRQKRRAAHNLGNPRLLGITFHTLRHWKATTEYHKTKDILHVMRLLGHRNIKNTLLYTQLIDTEQEEYICKIAKNAKEIAQLIQDGFEFVCEQQSLKFFRKRK